MTPPVRKLSDDLIQGHASLQTLRAYIQKKTAYPINSEDIKVSNGQPDDGFIDLNFYGKDGHLFLTRLNAYERFLQVSEGQVQKNGAMRWEPPVRLNIDQSCQTLHDLGGTEESKVQCNDAPLPSVGLNRAKWWGLAIPISYASLELGSRIFQKQSFTSTLLKNFKPVWKFQGNLRPGWGDGLRHGISTGLGFMAMWGTEQFANGLGVFHPRDHANERWALAATAGYGTYRLAHKLPLGPLLAGAGGAALVDQTLGRGLLGGLPLLRVGVDLGAAYGSYRLGKALMAKWGFNKDGLKPTSFAASLISASVADATIGRFFEPDSAARKFIHEGAFFLPQLYRSTMGQGSLAVMEESSAMKFVGKWGGRVVLASFLADLGYMTYMTDKYGATESGRLNRMYRRANELYEPEENPFLAVLSGATHLVAPAISERLFVPDAYVNKAKEEMSRQSLQYSTSIVEGLRHHLKYQGIESPEDLKGWGGDSLRGENELKNFVGPENRELPLEAVAEQLADPKVYEKRIQGKSEEEVVRYIQRQYRGWKLSGNEVLAILDRVQLYYTRQTVQDLREVGGPEAERLLQYFDAAGNLKAGKESELAGLILPRAEGIPNS